MQLQPRALLKDFEAQAQNLPPLSCLLRVQEPQFEGKTVRLRYFPFSPPALEAPLEDPYEEVFPLPFKQPPFLLLEVWAEGLVGLQKLRLPNALRQESVYGVVVHDGTLSIEDLEGHSKGSLSVFLAIGTVSQIKAWHSKFAKEAEQRRLQEEKKQDQDRT